MTNPAPEVRAMNTRYDCTCAQANCGAAIKRGHLLYLLTYANGARLTLCHACGRAFVDSLRG